LSFCHTRLQWRMLSLCRWSLDARRPSVQASRTPQMRHQTPAPLVCSKWLYAAPPSDALNCRRACSMPLAVDAGHLFYYLAAILNSIIARRVLIRIRSRSRRDESRGANSRCCGSRLIRRATSTLLALAVIPAGAPLPTSPQGPMPSSFSGARLLIDWFRSHIRSLRSRCLISQIGIGVLALQY